MLNTNPVYKLLYHVTILKNLQLKLKTKTIFMYFVIFTRCDMLEILSQSKLSMLIGFSAFKRNFLCQLLIRYL